MSQWTFVAAAYAIVAAATAALLVMSYLAMRRAEADVEAGKRQR
ncbi:hypothetical protein [Sphingomonas xanthus]|nr:hypothetical protein [Sphingomonas xanthus]